MLLRGDVLKKVFGNGNDYIKRHCHWFSTFGRAFRYLGRHVVMGQPLRVAVVCFMPPTLLTVPIVQSTSARSEVIAHARTMKRK